MLSGVGRGGSRPSPDPDHDPSPRLRALRAISHGHANEPMRPGGGRRRPPDDFDGRCRPGRGGPGCRGAGDPRPVRRQGRADRPPRLRRRRPDRGAAGQRQLPRPGARRRRGGHPEGPRRDPREGDLRPGVRRPPIDGDALPYIDNFVNLLVAEAPGDIAREEMLRVLCPGGVALVKRGDGLGEDRQALAGRTSTTGPTTCTTPRATPWRTTQVVGPPRHLQWVGNPRWSRHHDRMASMSALVSDGGRMFYIADEGSRVSIELPAKWALIARDAFNGTVLWKVPIAKWHDHMWPLKSGPTQLARRLVAQAGTGSTPRWTLDGPLTLPRRRHRRDPPHLRGDRDDRGGHPRRRHAVPAGQPRRPRSWSTTPRRSTSATRGGSSRNTSGTRPRGPSWPSMPTRAGSSGSRRASRPADPHRRRRPSRLPRRREGRQPRPDQRRRGLALRGGRAPAVHPVQLRPEGRPQGRHRALRRRQPDGGGASRRRPARSSGRPRTRGAATSRRRTCSWSTGLVWAAPTTSGRDSGIWTGRDLLTGAVKSEFPPDVDTYWFHHRCYIAKATDRFIMPSRTGIEFVDLAAGALGHQPLGPRRLPLRRAAQQRPDLRPAARLLVLPRDQALRLQRPGAGLVGPRRPRTRRDPTRPPGWSADRPSTPSSSATPTAPTTGRPTATTAAGPAAPAAQVPAELSKAWEKDLGGRLSGVVVAGGRLYVAQVDAHAVHAFDAATGEPLWSYTTGGRVDSPPTIAGGRLLFGSADGWVYCLKAERRRADLAVSAPPRSIVG